MEYNLKRMIRGTLTTAAGLAMLATAGCSTSREADEYNYIINSAIYAMCKATGNVTDAQVLEAIKNTTHVDGTFLNQPTIVQGQPGYMRIELQDSKGRKKVIQVEYPNRTNKSSDNLVDGLVQDLKEKSRRADIGRMNISMGFGGRIKPSGVITNSLSSWSIATSPRDFGK